MLMKIERRNIDKKKDFFSKMPFCSHWSEKQISKIIYSFVRKTYNRGHVVAKQGELASKVFYVESGEFECARFRKIKPLAV